MGHRKVVFPLYKKIKTTHVVTIEPETVARFVYKYNLGFFPKRLYAIR